MEILKVLFLQYSQVLHLLCMSRANNTPLCVCVCVRVCLLWNVRVCLLSVREKREEKNMKKCV